MDSKFVLFRYAANDDVGKDKQLQLLQSVTGNLTS